MNLEEQYAALEAEMLATDKRNSHKRTRLIIQMKLIQKQINHEKNRSNESI